MRLRNLLFIAATLVAAGAESGAQAPATDTSRAPAKWKVRLGQVFAWWDEDRTFTLYDENDAFGGTSDSAYTQGIRAQWLFNVWPTSRAVDFAIRHLTLPAVGEKRSALPTRKCDGRTARARRPCGAMSLAITQTMYTPPNLLNPRLDTLARPYAGYLGISVGANAVYPTSAVMTELSLGVTGPWAAAAETQSFAHWTWSQSAATPLGWHNQIENAGHLTLRSTWVAEPVEYCKKGCSGSEGEERMFDLIPDVEIVAGSLMNRVSVGLTGHLGYRFPDLMSPFRIPVSAAGPKASPGGPLWRRVLSAVTTFADSVRAQGWGVLNGNVTGRYVATNALIMGSYADGGANGWKTQRRISLDPLVHEMSWGWMLGARSFSISRQYVRRSSEYAPTGGSHTFGAWALSINSPMRGHWPRN